MFGRLSVSSEGLEPLQDKRCSPPLLEQCAATSTPAGRQAGASVLTWARMRKQRGAVTWTWTPQQTSSTGRCCLFPPRRRKLRETQWNPGCQAGRLSFSSTFLGDAVKSRPVASYRKMWLIICQTKISHAAVDLLIVVRSISFSISPLVSPARQIIGTKA